MTTTVLGANGKLGRILTGFARQTGLNWRSQARVGTVVGAGHVIWSGNFDDPATNDVLQRNGTVINMIGDTSADPHRLQAVNVHFVDDLLARAVTNGVAHVVLASSASVYGAGHDHPCDESAPLRPTLPYATSKAAMEDVAARYANDIAITILRIGNVAGADALTAVARRHIAAATPMPLHRLCDGSTPIRSYIGPHDLFRAVRDLSKPHDGPVRTLNVAHPQPVTLEAMLSAYRAQVLPDLAWSDVPAPDGTLARMVLSTAKLQAFTNFETHDDPASAFAAQLVEDGSL